MPSKRRLVCSDFATNRFWLAKIVQEKSTKEGRKGKKESMLVGSQGCDFSRLHAV